MEDYVCFLSHSIFGKIRSHFEAGNGVFSFAVLAKAAQREVARVETDVARYAHVAGEQALGQFVDTVERETGESGCHASRF